MALTAVPTAPPLESVVASVRGVPPVVWLLGEHDIATDPELAKRIAQAISRDDDDLVLDLSMVEFMGASTIGLIVGARRFLRARCRSLIVRSPSEQAWRVLDICGLASLLDPGCEAPTARAGRLPAPGGGRRSAPSGSLPTEAHTIDVATAPPDISPTRGH